MGNHRPSINPHEQPPVSIQRVALQALDNPYVSDEMTQSRYLMGRTMAANGKKLFEEGQTDLSEECYEMFHGLEGAISQERQRNQAHTA